MEITDTLKELKSTKLWSYLDSVNTSYADKALIFVKEIAPILASIQDIFPYYTRHDAHHGFRVLKRIEQIIDARCLEITDPIHLTSDETLLLICSAYAHDLGMAVFPNEEQSLFAELGLNFTKNWKKDAKLQDYLRKKHSERGGQYISTNIDKIGIPPNIVFMLHSLMEAHNLSIADLDSKLKNPFAAGEEEIDLKQLACILCIGDALEFSETRVMDGVIDQIIQKRKEKDSAELKLSLLHNLQSLGIGNGLAITNTGKITITGTFSDPEALGLAHNTIDLIENWIRDYVDIDFQSNKRRLKVRADSIIRELHIIGFDFERIGIRIKKENIIELISSNATWSTDTGIVIRELLQNSVEACRYRKFHSPNYYKPQVFVKLDADENTIEIQDNGCGMSRNTILNNFLNVGSSRSSEPSYYSKGYSSLARFGIGFWSAFTIANSALISTAPFEYLTLSSPNTKIAGVEFEMSIQEFKDFTVFAKKEMNPGTVIKLFLKDDFNFNDFIYKIKYHIGASEIPIHISDSKGLQIVIPSRIELPSMKEIFGNKIKIAEQSNLREYYYENIVNEIDIKIKFYYQIFENGLNFPSNTNSFSILKDRGMDMKFRGMGICGFLFNYIPRTHLFDLYRIGIVGANALNPTGYKFTINRNGVLESKEYVEFKATIDREIHNCVRTFLNANKSFNAQTVSRLSMQSKANGGEQYGMYTSDQLSTLVSNDRDLIAFKLFKIDKTRSIDSCDVKYLFYEELIETDCNLWTYHPPYLLYSRLNEHIEKSNAYEFLKSKINGEVENYLLERCRESDMLADNAIDCIIDATLLIGKSNYPFTFRNFLPKKVAPNYAKSKVMAFIRGTWSGWIVEQEIIGANFLNLSQGYFIVKPNSLICNHLKKLIDRKEFYNIAELIGKLTDHYTDVTDEEYLRFFLGGGDDKSITAFITVG